MTTFAPPDIHSELQRFSPTDTAIAAMNAAYMPLVIRGVEDVEGFKAVHSARMIVREHRVAVEKIRKELKADALEYGRKVDGEAKRINAMLEPIETHLTEEESVYNQAREAIRNAAKIKAEQEAAAAKAAEEARIKAEQEAETARLRVESERLAADRVAMEAERQKIEAAQAAERQRQRAEQEKIDAERRAVETERQRLADLEAARLRKIDEERIAAEASERSRVETEQRIARQAELMEVTRIKAESMRPDCEKLHAIAIAVSAIAVPPVCHEAAEFARRIQDVLSHAVEAIDKIVAEMTPEPF